MKRLAVFLAVLVTPLAARSVDPRWGHRAAFIESSQTLIIHGGKSDPTSSYSYTSAPNTGETLYLDLSQDTTSTEPKWTVIRDDGPTVAWHTLDFLKSSGGGGLLVTGGDGGSELAIQTRNDSIWLITPNPSFTSNITYHQQTNLVQPIRKVFSASSRSGDGDTVFITGGEKNDGSGLGYKEAWAVTDSNGLQYTALPDLPTDLVHHQSVMLGNGTLVLIGGLIPSASAFLSLSTLYSLDTTTSSSLWKTINLPATSPNVPSTRRGHTATLVTDPKGKETIFLVGGISGSLQGGYVLDDMWRLDVAMGVWEEVAATGSARKRGEGESPSGRFDHVAVAVDQQLLVFGGYGASGPADEALYIMDTVSATWTDGYQAPANAKEGSTSSSASAIASASSSVSGKVGSSSTSTGDKPSRTTAKTAISANSSSTSSATANPEEDMKSSINTTAIAIGSTFGALALIALILALCLIRRQRKKAVARSTLTPFGGQPLRQKRFGRGKRNQALSEKLEGPWDASEKDDILGDDDAGESDHRRYRQSFGYEEGFTNSQQPYGQASGHGAAAIGLGRPLVNNIAAKIRQVSERMTSNPKQARFSMLEDEDREDLLWKGDGEGSDDEGYEIHHLGKDDACSPAEGGDAFGSMGSQQSWPNPPDRVDTYKQLPVPPRTDSPGPSPVSSSHSGIDESLGSYYDSGIQSYVQNGSTNDRSRPPKSSMNSRDSMTESMMTGAVQTATKVSVTTAEASYVPLKREETWLQRVAGNGVASLFRSKQGSTQRMDEGFLDPTTPPVLDSIREDDSRRSSDRPSVFGNFGHSVASVVSAATANSAFLERYGQMNILQRESTSSSDDAALPAVPARREILRPATPPRGPRPAPLRMPTHIDVGSGPNRRPVKDIAASINRRGSVMHDDILPGSPLALGEGRTAVVESPINGSQSRTRSPLTGPRHAQTTYQAVPRAPFAIANNV